MHLTKLPVEVLFSLLLIEILKRKYLNLESQNENLRYISRFNPHVKQYFFTLKS